MSLAWQATIAGIILGSALALALLIHPALTRFGKMIAARTKTTLDDLLIDAVSRPLFLFILVHGFFLALTSTTLLDRWQMYVNKAWLSTALLILVYGLQKVAKAVLTWYGQEIASKTGSRVDDKLLPLVRRVVTGLIYVIGGLMILENLGLRLSPLIAGLGLGGLAVALALQATLSNLLAGASVVADGSIGVGDYIELQGGPSGTVEDIGWRTTKIQTSMANMVLIPNNKLVDSIVTNYQSPTPALNVFISCGVSYQSDLNQVERTCLEVATQVIHDLPEAVVVKDYQPGIWFMAFGDSNINFSVVLRATNRVGSFQLTHEFIKRLHARFAQEGIEINYPVRKLVYATGDEAGGRKDALAFTSPTPPDRPPS
ncbi:MAG: mechanosensitive ion channel family protein [Dehalococcoidia bacterium]|nr:mechanosensitive ion channel family protein [Dehalococcoidia bacterium]